MHSFIEKVFLFVVRKLNSLMHEIHKMFDKRRPHIKWIVKNPGYATKYVSNCLQMQLDSVVFK